MVKIAILVGTDKGAFLYQSDEQRRDWKIQGPLLKGWKVYDLQLDQRSKPRLFAAVGSYVYGPTIHVSDDLGKSWRQIEHGPRYGKDASGELKAIWCIVPGRADEPEVLYAGVADAGLFISRDRGEHWEELPGLSEHPTRSEWVGGLGGLCCHTILPDPHNARRIWAAISAVGVFRSDDGGDTWAVKNRGLAVAIEGKTHKEIGSCVHRLVLDPGNSNRLFQQNHQGVFRSVDGGDSWERIETGLPSTFGFPMVMTGEDPSTLFIIPQESDEYRFPKEGRLQVYRSSDGGDSWHPAGAGLPDHFYTGVLRQAMTVDAFPEAGIYFGTAGGQLFYSRNGGERWEQLPGVLPRIYSVSTALIR